MKKLTKNLLIFIIFTLLFCVFGGCTSKDTSTVNPSKITVVASFYPLAEFSRQVGKDNIDVLTITPSGVEPHDYEPTPGDIAKIDKADIFLFNGLGVDPWAEKAIETVKGSNVEVINMSEQMSLIKGVNDPHFWLSPQLAIKEVHSIETALSTKDPLHANEYQKNADQYIKQLTLLDDDFKQTLSSCKIRSFITSHRAFDYLAKEYGLEQISIAGFSPEEEPSAQRLADLAKLSQEKNINIIFFETLANPSLSETIAKEVGAKSMVLNPLEGLTKEESDRGEDYISIMRENMKNLKIALQCS